MRLVIYFEIYFGISFYAKNTFLTHDSLRADEVRYFHTELNETLAVPLSYIRQDRHAGRAGKTHVESKYIADANYYMSVEKVERKLPMHLACPLRSVRSFVR